MKLFISHVSADEEIASILKEYIESIFLNATVFVSGTDLVGGQVWMERLREALHDTTAIVALVTPRSLQSKWVLFEAGAGFVSRRTIPVITEGLSIVDVGPPLSLLQARHIDAIGLKSLACDIAKLGNVREPNRFPSLEATLTSISMILKDYLGGSLDSSSVQSYSPVTTQRTAPADQTLNLYKSEAIALARDVLRLLVKQQRASFDLPPDEEIDLLDTSDLDALGQTVGASLPNRIRTKVLLLPLAPVPTTDDPHWKKVKFNADIQELRKALEVLRQNLVK